MSIQRELKIDREATYTQEELLASFPDVDPGFSPLGSRIIVQIRSPKSVSRGIILSDETKEIEKWNTQIGKVRSIGPVAFRNRNTLELWSEGKWFEVGDFVRVPKFNQDRWEIEVDCGEKNGTGQSVKTSVLFMCINDLDIIAKKIGNPLEVKAYI